MLGRSPQGWGTPPRRGQWRGKGLFWHCSFVLKICTWTCIFVKLFIDPQNPGFPTWIAFSQLQGRDLSFNLLTAEVYATFGGVAKECTSSCEAAPPESCAGGGYSKPFISFGLGWGFSSAA